MAAHHLWIISTELLMPSPKVLAVVLVTACLASCTTTYITPMAVSQPKRLDLAQSQSATPLSKTFSLPRDWQYDSWVMKKGSNITFNADGTGTFSITAYSQFTKQHDELHFQSIQYGADGNTLFVVPGSDVGYPIHLRGSYRDFVYTGRFGFDRRYFPYIEDVKFFARLYLMPGTVGHPHRSKTRSEGSTSIP
jgi:hypothetical protein